MLSEGGSMLEQVAVVAEEDAQAFGDGPVELAVRDVETNIIGDVHAEQKGAFLRATVADAALLARWATKNSGRQSVRGGGGLRLCARRARGRLFAGLPGDPAGVEPADDPAVHGVEDQRGHDVLHRAAEL